MAARYRCPFCGSFANRSAKDTRNHILQRHRMLLIEGLGLIETFTTRNPPDPPRNALKGHPTPKEKLTRVLDPGVSGEGDSSCNHGANCTCWPED